jgi:phosphopantothenoylcysteine synthetase/decarboxylase
MKTILLGVCGATDAKRVYELILKLQNGGFKVKVILTNAAKLFVSQVDLMTNAKIHPYTDDNNTGYMLTSIPKYHLNLASDCDCFLVAPCTANTLAKFSLGLADNMLTTTMRCWNFDKPVFIAPAMNPYMWNSSFTKEHINKFLSLGDNIEIIMPTFGKFENCEGIGHLAPYDTIFACVNTTLGTK